MNFTFKNQLIDLDIVNPMNMEFLISLICGINIKENLRVGQPNFTDINPVD